jgi:ABC-type nitrate/sulfonate/bicarbonate transport system permease component
MIETTRDKVTAERSARGRRRTHRGRAALSWVIPALALVALLVVWELWVWIDNTPRWFIPSPSAVASEAFRSRALLWEHTWTTLQEVLVGYLLAVVIGVGVALAIGSSRLVERTVYPLIVATQAIPIIALAPVLLIWFGYGMTPKVVVVILLCFFPIAVNMADGLRSADPDAIALLRSMGASRWQLTRIVRAPASLPYLASGARIAAAVSIIGAIVGEWVGASSGLGYLMTRSAAQLQTARLFAAVGIAALLGIGMFALVALLGRWLVPWQTEDVRNRSADW